MNVTMLKKILSFFLIAAAFMLSIKCVEESNPKLESENFTSIFDNDDFNASFTPVDMLQTADGGYLVLGERRLKDTRLTGIYLLKADPYGNFVKFLEVGDTLVNPVGKFTPIENQFYFFCMETTSSTGNPARVKLASVDENLDDFRTTSIGSLTYPAVASFVDEKFVLLSYDNGNKASVISELSNDGVLINSKGYTVGVGEGSEKAILNHYLKEGKQFPFEVGLASNGTYYFNGFYDYTFSLVFTDIDADEPLGIVQGQQDNGGFSAITALGTGKFATARFNFGDNYFLPNPSPSISTAGNSYSASLGGYSLPELIPDAKVKILQATINDTKVLIYGSDTQTRQIGLYFYDETSGEFMSSRYLGFSNPFQIANMLQTSDGGLAVCGTTYLAGRFPRICIFKLSRDEISKNVTAITNH
jgi:hypothetical protein